MYYWIIYDISHNRTRAKIAKACKRAGLHRVQKSVFLGKIGAKMLGRMRTEFNRSVNWRTDKVFFVPMRERDYRRVGQTGPKRRPPLHPSSGTPFFY
jgi:CRISPR-associated protein Cas2